MHIDLGRAKQRRYTELAQEMYDLVFAVPNSGGNPDHTCSVCGDDSRKTSKFDEDERQERICELCNSFAEELGKSLPKANFIALGWQVPQDTQPGTALDALKSFGMQIQLLEKAEEKIALESVERITFWALDDPNHGWPQASSIPAAFTLGYSVNAIPPMTFDELQDEVEEGFKRLGVLRMDVDNLGDIFKKGLGKYATLARLSTLSFQMALFFKGWVKRICDAEMFANKIYAVYAGGDDVFLIGPWDIMPDLAMRIRDDFARYTNQHPDLHLSAGLAFIGGKYPIYQAAEDAEFALNSAKRRDGKNAFGFLGSVWTWAEFEQVKAKYERLVHIVDKKQLAGPQAIIQILRELAEQKTKRVTKTKLKDVWGPWQWRGAYLLKRMEEREKGKPELAQAIRSIREGLDANEYKELNQWSASARWAQLKTRKKSKKESEK